MRSFQVVNREIAFQPLFERDHANIFFEGDVFVFDVAPKPFHENVVEDTAPTTIQTGLNRTGFQFFGKRDRGELNLLVAVENRRHPFLLRLFC